MCARVMYMHLRWWITTNKHHRKIVYEYIISKTYQYINTIMPCRNNIVIQNKFDTLERILYYVLATFVV